MSIYVTLFLALWIQFIYCDQFDPTTHRAWDLVNDKACGIRTQQRVVGGNDAAIGEFPWVVEIHFQNQEGEVVVICEGGIISERFVITAAHCVSEERIATISTATVLAGELDKDQDPDCDSKNVCAPPVKKHQMEKFIPHPEFQEDEIGRDIGLVKIQDKFQFNDFIAPVCLEYGPLLSEDYTGAEAEFAGWGVYKTGPNSGPSVLQKITLRIQSMDDCEKAIEFIISGYNFTKPDVATYLCAGGEAGRFIYWGDSGAVLAIPKTVGGDIPRLFAVGVATLTSNEEPRVTPVADGFTRVSHYLEWILDNIATESGI